MKCKKKDISCFDCVHSVYVGEGGFVCTECGEPKIVIEDFSPSEDFVACEGKKFIEDY